MDPKGKTVLVTGGAHRVGKAIVLGLADAGVNVIINYHSSDREAKKTVEEALSLGVEALAIQSDIGNPQQVKKMVASATEKFGSIDILINSASPWIQTPFPTDELEDWHRVTNILINGAFYCANAVAPIMLKNKTGSIINIIDQTAYVPKKNYAAHTVGKTALLGLTRQLALELAPNISVNAISPGPVLPPSHYDEKKLRQTANRTLMDRWGTTQDVVDAVLFLVRSSYITGEVINIDGGERFGHMKRVKK